jgi:uncharacterized protein YprB with RNaseH-like and TPR domain
VTLGDRLRSLQRQAGSTDPARPAVASADSVGGQLRRLMGLRERALRRTSLAAPAGRQIGDGLFLVEDACRFEGSTHYVLPWGEPDRVDRERLVCFDTETTGLAGGVGTKAFMIGVATWQGANLITRQLYLTRLCGEEQMLATFDAWLPDDAVLLSYNGRSYDAPLLKGRYRMHRRQHRLDALRHVDLLYPVRRAYRGVWENCRLQTIERHLLGIVREDDLPGSEAPAAWRDFLRGESSVNLRRVIEHNRQDVATLAALMHRLCASNGSTQVDTAASG